MATAAAYRRPSIAGLESTVANPYGGAPNDDLNEYYASIPTAGQTDFARRHAAQMALYDEDVNAAVARGATPVGKAMQEADANNFYNSPAGRSSMEGLRKKSLYESGTGDMARTASDESQAYDYFATPRANVRNDQQNFAREQFGIRYVTPAQVKAGASDYTADKRFAGTQVTAGSRQNAATTAAQGKVAAATVAQPGAGGGAVAGQQYLDERTQGDQDTTMTMTDAQGIAQRTGRPLWEVISRAQTEGWVIDPNR